MDVSTPGRAGVGWDALPYEINLHSPVTDGALPAHAIARMPANNAVKYAFFIDYLHNTGFLDKRQHTEICSPLFG
jgi:hypothetical protein